MLSGGLRPLQLSDGSQVTVKAWLMDELVAHPLEFMALIDALNAPITGQPADLFREQIPAALHRAVRVSLQQPEDMQRVKVADLPDLLEAIWEVNAVQELQKKSLSFRLRIQQAQAEVLRPLSSP
ncbi:hypothetical protein D3875_04070 [Deinococcus cavernae]|uniref:Uncharacterized protein n=1 Tax=Deinococcus cavernae TaxID=2320857 RepID=A0A418VEI4_9DEIO|nr:hypothetical protein D3875_04070 [Deinococcus cavernae]